jgi:CubicO group peptidase (beta-lactamase class C family)
MRTLFHFRSLFIAFFGFLSLESFAQSPTYSKEVEQRIQLVEKSLAGQVMIEGTPNWTIEERMAFHKIPGVTIAVISNYKVEWAKGYGLADKEQNRAVTPTTLFQAASISKSLNAVGVLKLVQDKKIDLNADINTYLKTWKFPYDSVSKGKKISVYNLLTHTAGLTVHGFPGYETTDQLPTVSQILDGEKPANTKAVRSAFEPGVRFQYSGGGTTISQLIVTDVTKKPYDQYMLDNVLKPLGMSNSFYSVPPPAAKANQLATAYGFNGAAKQSKYHLYPEQGAASLWTNPTDLAQYIIETQLAVQGKSSKVLNKETTKIRLTPFPESGAGLGVFIEKKGDIEYFQHGGSNEGFRCQYFGSLDGKGNGVVVMVNSDNGSILPELVNSVAKVYDWKGFYAPTIKKLVDVPEETLAKYVGKYQIAPSFVLAISLEGNKLKVEPTGQEKFDLFAEDVNKFFLTVVDAKIEFVTGSNGSIEKLILYQNGRAMDGPKIP